MTCGMSSHPTCSPFTSRKLGPWELQCLRAQADAARARRKLELARAALNRGQAPDWQQIDEKLEEELLTWQQRVREAARAFGGRRAAAGPPAFHPR